MQAELEHAAEVGAAADVAGIRAHLRAACEQNADLSERVIWCVEVDWARTRDKIGHTGRLETWFRAAFCWEWWAVTAYRLAYWSHRRVLPDLGPHRFLQLGLLWQQAALLRFCYLVGQVCEGLSGARLSGLAEIGPGLLLAHTGSCGIGSGVVIGHTFTMYQDSSAMAGKPGVAAPIIGDRVTLYSGARISGPVHVGSEVRVGANALVLHDLPACCMAIGVPARPIANNAHQPDYPATLQVRDLLATLVESGQLREIRENRYLDTGTGSEITVQMPE